jgi:hypothetical protein
MPEREIVTGCDNVVDEVTGYDRKKKFRKEEV